MRESLTAYLVVGGFVAAFVLIEVFTFINQASAVTLKMLAR